MRLLSITVLLVASMAVAGCDTKIDDKQIRDQKAEVAKLEAELETLRKAKTPSDPEEQNALKERIAELEKKLKSEQDKLQAMTARREFERSVDKRLKEYERDIEKLTEQAAEAAGDAKVELRKRIAGLKTRRDQILERYEDLKAASGDAWAAGKRKMEEELNELAGLMKDAVQEFKEKVTAQPAETEKKD